MTQGQVRVRAISFAVITYTALTTIVTDDFIQTWPPAQGSHTVFVLSSLAIRTITLASLLGIFQKVAERFWARHILGKWIYRSSGGNYGLASIRFADGDLYYSVQLFPKLEELVDVVENNKPINPMAVVNSEMFKYDSATGIARGDYHIESTNSTFQSRKGLVVLTATGPGQMKGQWYSTLDGKTGDLEFLRKGKYKQAFGGTPLKTAQH